ncbi:non-canonical purine NTP pyrophosphatase [Spirochaetia bacterium]|nr:non-canonical purine NTP pyrophosphatase [Spirochaetia bacterium]
MTVWFASGNEHKRKEVAGILSKHTIKIPLDEGIAFDPAESGKTFVDNALLKARALFELTGEPVIADDSGLCVDALGGRPGIFSARYGGGKKISDSERNALLLREIGNNQLRSARFVCAFVLLLDNERFFIAQETLEGEIVTDPCGDGGFGYDPLLYIREKGCTVSQLTEVEKNKISHRAKAAAAIARWLD